MPDASHPTGEDRTLHLIPGGSPAGDARGAAGVGLTEEPPGNLPLALTSFVGREREKAEVEKLLGGARLLTLTGPGGCGKTRLALAVAGDLSQLFEDGVWWVGLAPLSDPALVPQAVASVLRVYETAGRPLTEVIAEDLSGLDLLLVLDNCEHIVGACAELADTLLISSPGLKILATSREALGVAGERRWAVPPLPSPDPGSLPSIEDLGRVESVRLFVERARYRLPGFSLDPRHAASVAEICAKLEGMPLAIELAAARVGTLSVAQISARLGRSLSLLAGRERTAPERQRTLRGALEWSHDLLCEEEKLLFSRLSVFAGGFTLDAAEVVATEPATGDGIQDVEVMDLLGRLVDKSLILTRPGTQQNGLRYRMLEPVRQFATEKLDVSGETEEVKSRHARYFLDLAEKAEGELGGRDQAAWLERLEVEHDNFGAALKWALEAGENELALRVSAALGDFWHLRGRLGEGQRWLEAALAEEDAPELVRAKAFSKAGWIAWEQGDYERSLALNQESLDLARKLEDDATVALALSSLALTMIHRNRYEQASDLIQEALPLQRAAGNMEGVALALTSLAMIAMVRHRYDQAVALYEESLDLAREAENDFATAFSLVVGANAFLGRGDQRQVRELCEKGLDIARRRGMLHLIASNLHVLAGLAGSQGQPERSARLWGAAESLREVIGTVLSPVETDYYDPFIVAARNQLGDEAAWKAAWASGRAMTCDEAIEYALGPSTLDDAKAPIRRFSAQPLYEPLTARELEVLGLISDGLSNQQIAARMYVAVSTVKTYVNAIFKKLDANNRTRAVAEARRIGLLSR